jgi:N,N'-diacetyllegionaminate synthase
MRKVKIGKFEIGAGRPSFVIAEIGGNFTRVQEAVRLIDAAADCGVDAVKLQTLRASTVTSKKAMFDMENTGKVPQYELFLQYELDEKSHRQIFDHAASRGLMIFSTPSYFDDADLLDRLGVPAYKVGSDDANNIPFLEYLARKGKPVILSTGMCTLEEVKESVDAIQATGNRELIVLHAITSYPTHPEHVNLRAMTTMARAFDVPVGYSDHTVGNEVCLAAVALGAAVIEKHFTLDKKGPGPDHRLSADPADMKALVREIRVIEASMGDGVKKPAGSEATTRINNRKSVVAVSAIPKGAIVTRDAVAVKRPGLGILPKEIGKVVGRKAKVDIAAEDVITWDMLL